MHGAAHFGHAHPSAPYDGAPPPQTGEEFRFLPPFAGEGGA